MSLSVTFTTTFVYDDLNYDNLPINLETVYTYEMYEVPMLISEGVYYNLTFRIIGGHEIEWIFETESELRNIVNKLGLRFNLVKEGDECYSD